MARILLIESATDWCSVAITENGRLLALVETPTQSHAAVLTLQVDECCRQAGLRLAQIDAVAVGSGPGSYTSLRVGASVAKGICYALDKPLIAVDTLLTLASAARNATPPDETLSTFYLPALDARRQEIWTALYDESLQLLLPAQPVILENNLLESLVRTAAGPDKMVRLAVSGNGSEKIRSGHFFEITVFFTDKMCSAAHLAPFAETCFENNDFQDIAYFEPFYMKMPNITTPNNISF